MIDGLLPFGSNISNISCSAFFHLLDFVLHFPQHSNEVLIHALVTSRIAYCNSLLVGIPEKQFHRLQLIQNSAARIVTNSRTFDHILYLQFLFSCKNVLFLTYKALHNLAPHYLSDLLHLYTPLRSLRSSSADLLSVPKFKMSSFGGRAFSCVAPKLWNSLPLNIRQLDSISHFKVKIKTHLFRIAFNDLLV